jgi:CRP/FNR family transcriptional regulator, anaerobic regulatory protein
MYTSLFTTIQQKIQLTKADEEQIAKYFEPIAVIKNSTLQEEQKIPTHLYFVNKGYLRLFYYNDEGDEVTTLVASPNWFVTPFLQFIHQQPSTENLECITDCELLIADRHKLMELIETNENFKKYSLLIFEQALISTQHRANDLATLSAEQRYLKLVEQQPEIIQNVPIQYIASYLGIKPQSLSRIRKQQIK